MKVRKLEVHRRLSDGSKKKVGELAQNQQGIFFQYDKSYIEQHQSLSPFTLPFNESLHRGPQEPHQGLHGVFADSLPDGWGLLLMDRVFRQQGILPHQITPLDRLAFIGQRGMGSLRYFPATDYEKEQDGRLTDIAMLGLEAQQLFEGQTDDVLPALAQAGGSGGARPKASVWLDPDNPHKVSTLAKQGLSPWLVKFTSKNLPLGHEEGLCEAAWLTMAADAGLMVPKWELIHDTGSSEAVAWLALQRFDCSQEQPEPGRLHMHTLCGLMDADYRKPSMDYDDLLKVSQVLCQSPAAAQEQFVRAMFNLFGLNQDDHTKNWSFLMDDAGQWSLAPFYDVTFSPSPYNQHMMAYLGHGSEPPVKAVQKLAKQANIATWNQAKKIIERVVDALQNWSEIAADLDVKPSTKKLIGRQLDETWKANKRLL
ncbi:type II toxin-antitoxin system HipA family toxin [Endozoicomonas arenosclerae]|uniref:type II toxin-antitoxin system HipA family toxin n=1 Tax=Endozoicomonas arenosclerae TaxID=1633495 RepID=UPI0007865E79|nr:type II toxin-antitoxin system HipA family toxin [Endozoicomonas arenosclerae]